MNFGDWVSAVQNAVQIAAIVIGAVWAYYKFFRGRTFHRRAEVRLDASLLAEASSRAVRAHATLVNTGTADIPLRVKAVKVLSFKRGDVDEKGRPRWADVAIAPVFQDHGWIESQETITDDVLIPLSSDDADEGVVAFRVTCVVYERRRRRLSEVLHLRADPGGGICWTTHTIVPSGFRTEAFDPHGFEAYGHDAQAFEPADAFEPEPPVFGQRDAEEDEIRRIEGDAGTP
jgi:hypothetical protein